MTLLLWPNLHDPDRKWSDLEIKYTLTGPYEQVGKVTEK